MTMQEADGIRIHRNPRLAPRAEPYGSARERILNQAGFLAAEQEISRWPGHAETPLHHLPGLAARLGVAALHYKDECGRFGLKSFKALGGAYAVFRLLKKMVEARNGGQPVDSQQMIAGTYRDIVQTVTVRTMSPQVPAIICCESTGWPPLHASTVFSSNRNTA